MRHRIVIPLLFLLVGSHVQAVTLSGVVRKNEIGGTPLSDVQISTVKGERLAHANPTVSNSDGSFTLQFPEEQIGEIVKILVTKQGYVVVNDLQLRLALPKYPELLDILLCKEGDREEMARRFYRLKSVEVIEQFYQQRLKGLEEKNLATATALEELRRDRDRAKAAAEKAAEELARLKPGSTSELYQQAMSLFLAGKPEEALNLLDQETLQKAGELARQHKAEAEKESEEVVQNYLLRAQLLVTLLRFSEAERAYQEAIELKPDSLEAQLAFAYFNKELNRFSKASTAYGLALNLARQRGNLLEVMTTLNNLGVVQGYQNRMQEALRSYEEALKISRELAQRDPDAYTPYVAGTLNNLGTLQHDQNQPKEANKNFEEALKTYQALARKDPDTYLPHVADTLNNLGILQSDLNRVTEALSSYEEALKIYRALAQNDPDTYLPFLAMILNNLGSLQEEQHRMAEALLCREEALKIRRQLAQKNPDKYLPNVAMTLDNLGVLKYDQNQTEEAVRFFEESLKIRRELAQKEPETYLPDVAATLNNLGSLQRRQSRIAEALRSYEEALRIRRELAQKNPDRHLPDVATVLNNLGVLQSDQHQMTEAFRSFEEALRIYRELTKESPDKYLSYVAGTLNNLGNVQGDQHRVKEALRSYEEALTIYRELSRKNPDKYLPDVATMLNNLGIFQRNHNRIEALQYHGEALKIYQKMTQANPGIYEPKLSETLVLCGIIHHIQGKTKDARSLYQKALEIYENLAKQDQQQYEKPISTIKGFLSDLDKQNSPPG